eukprot:757218-Hanusia_phi.AAC.8
MEATSMDDENMKMNGKQQQDNTPLKHVGPKIEVSSALSRSVVKLECIRLFTAEARAANQRLTTVIGTSDLMQERKGDGTIINLKKFNRTREGRQHDETDKDFSPKSIPGMDAHETEARLMGIPHKLHGETDAKFDHSHTVRHEETWANKGDKGAPILSFEQIDFQSELRTLISKNKFLEEKLFEASVEAARAENRIRMLETSLDKKQSLLEELSSEDYDLRHFEESKQRQKAQEVLIRTQFFAQELFVSIKLAKEETELSLSELQENLLRVRKECQEKDIMFKHYLGKYKELSAKWKEQEEQRKNNDNSQGQTIWQLRSHVQELEKQLAAEFDAHLKLKSMSKSRERETAELRKRNSRLANEMEEQRNHREISLIENEELRREIARVLDNEQRLVLENDNLRSQVAVLENQFETLKKENEEIRHVNNLCSKTASATTQDLNNLKKELEAAKLLLKERDSQVQTYQENVKMLKLRVKELEHDNTQRKALSEPNERQSINRGDKPMASHGGNSSWSERDSAQPENEGALAVRSAQVTSMELAMKNLKQAYLDTSFPFFLNFVQECSERLATVKQMTLEMETSCERLTYELNSTKFKCSRLERRLMETERSRHEITMALHDRSSHVDGSANLSGTRQLSRTTTDVVLHARPEDRGPDLNDLHLLQELRDTKVQLVELEAFMSILDEEKNAAKAELAVTQRMLMSASGSLGSSQLPSFALGDVSSSLWNNIKDLERLLKEAQKFFEREKETTFFKEMAEMRKSISLHARPQPLLKPSPFSQPPQEPLATTSAPLLKSFHRTSNRRSGAERDVVDRLGERSLILHGAPTMLKSPRTLAHRQQTKTQPPDISGLSNASQRVLEIQRLLGR